jgi:predicted secreted protein
MMKKLIVILALAWVVPLAVVAGDVANLVNLGFSPDSSHFMFGFHGFDVQSGKPYAELFIVDTKKNNFVQGGTFKGLYAIEPQPGWNPAGAFYRLFSDATAVARKFGIDHLNQGRLVYLLLDGLSGPDSLSFKDFGTGAQWEVKLNETIEETNGSISSSFGLELVITDTAGKKTSVKAGNPQIKRKGIENYTMREILVAGDGKTVVILIERVERTPLGPSIRFMVETFRLP